MPETLPVIRVDPVTVAVTVCPGPPTVMDVLLTAVTRPITKSVLAPPEPVPGSAPLPPGWLLPPGTTGVREEGWPAAPGVAPEEPASPSTASTIPAPAAAARSAITSRSTGRRRRADDLSCGQPGGLGGAARGPPGAPPPGPSPGGSSSPGHRSSGQSPRPGPPEPEDRCDIGCSPTSPDHVVGLGTGATVPSTCHAAPPPVASRLHRGRHRALCGCNRGATPGHIDLAEDAAPMGRTVNQTAIGSADHVLHHLSTAGAAPQDAAGHLHRAGPRAGDRPRRHRHRRLGRGEEGPVRRAEIPLRGRHGRHGHRQGAQAALTKQRSAEGRADLPDRPGRRA